MKHYVREMLARHMGVSVHSIKLWRLTAGQGSVSASRRGGPPEYAPGMLEAELEVEVSANLVDIEHLQLHRKSSLVTRYVSPYVKMGETVVDIKISLLKGKETQHLFKAVLQSFTVRGPQKRKKR